MTTEYKSFSEELRLRSQAMHDKSDKLVNLKLAVALTNTKLYGTVLRDFYCIYEAIENQVKKYQMDNQLIHEIWLPEMSRTVAFEKDLDYYLGVGWKKSVVPSEAAQLYTAHIYSVVDKEPELLVAYIHTMYLAILSGGYIIKKLVVNTLGIRGTDGGVAAFDFPEDVFRVKLKNHIKNSIDVMDIDRDLKDRMVAEKIMIFRKNNEIVASIKPTLSSGARIFKFVSLLAGTVMLICYTYSKFTSGN